MDLAIGGEYRNLAPTPRDARAAQQLNGQRPNNHQLFRIGLSGGEQVEFSEENGEKISNGNSKISQEEEVSSRYAHDDIVISNPKSENYGEPKRKVNCSLDTKNGDIDAAPESRNSGVSDETVASISKIMGETQAIIRPHSHLPKPEAPAGLTITTPAEDDNMPSIGKYFRQKSNSLSAAIARRISSLKDFSDEESVTEINLSGVKVIVTKLNDGEEKEEEKKRQVELKGRISFFSRSNCRDCKAVRSFLRERRLKYVEINIDVFPMREKELIARTGSSSVPQIFFNDKLFGGLVAVNSLRNSGTLEERLKELLRKKCPNEAPAPPVYGFDDPEEERTDEMVGIVRAIEIGKQLAQKHFIHHVFGEIEFEDGNLFYRFLEHEPFIPRCFNFRGSTNDSEPKSAAIVGLRLTKIMSAILESFASEDQQHLDYAGISNSEEFRRYITLVQDLHRVNIFVLSANEKLAFFLNLYNAMVIHAVIMVGHPGGGVIDRRSFYSDFLYVIGGHPYSLATIKNGILRSNRRAPYSLIKPFGTADKRLELTFSKVNPLIHFGLCNGTRSSPTVRFFSPQGVESELRYAAREFFQKDGMEVDLAKRTVYLTRIIKWYNVDFGQDKEILQWLINFLDASNAGLLTHLLGDGGSIHIAYQNYDWSVNC
ncbi:hypothetical protein RJ639_028399 [Escallonia herrerae]|uniref:Dishevelled n=1 Tax=Escallonia herrerae TaxID=1293975 RepID=A0AA88X656_9ASTE|nr:hypothetical protein RJ639_028399 [Escallonia herrerae]